MLSLHGFWTILLYLGFLGIIWVPRCHIVPKNIRLWPTYWLYSTFTDSLLVMKPHVQPITERYDVTNYTLNIDHRNHDCFTCHITLQPKQCFLRLTDAIFPLCEFTKPSYSVQTIEKYPCYGTVAMEQAPHSNRMVCGVKDEATHLLTPLNTAGCSTCSICNKKLVHNSSTRLSTREPRFSISVSNQENTAVILHCLHKLSRLKLSDQEEFCDGIQDYVSIYKEDGVTVFSGCKNLCGEAVNAVHRELYSLEVEVWLTCVAGVVVCSVGVAWCASQCYSVCSELAIFNIAWNERLVCPICMEKLRPLSRVRTLQCGHTFCGRCLHRWLRVFGHVTCPMCRQPVDGHVQRLSTTDLSPTVIPPPTQLMISPQSEAGGDAAERMNGDQSLTNSSSLVQSIYNIGRNVVSGWSVHHTTRRSELQESEHEISPLLSDGGPVLTEMLEPSNHIFNDHSTLLFYPIFPSTSSPSATSQIVLPYSSTSLTSPPCPSSPAYVITGNICHTHVTCSCHTASSDYMPPFGDHTTSSLDFSHSDTEILGPSLQDRIARKLNRIKTRRLRNRRTQSTSDLTSVTSHSESEND